MPDNGQLAQLCTRIAAILDALGVFKTADLWKHQITLSGAGLKDIGKYAPFAFVGYMNARGNRQGDYDLKQDFTICVMIGQDSKEPGVCIYGDPTRLGTSKLRELVIAALDNQHPGEGFACDDMEYEDEIEWTDQPTEHAIQMFFKVPSMAITQPE